jgi:hypothetical protein
VSIFCALFIKRKEIQAYLFAIALPMVDWSWNKAIELSECVLYPEVMMLVIRECSN